MKKKIFTAKLLGIFITVFLTNVSLNIHAEGHYGAGVEGIKGASVPPPGVYYLGYFINYRIDSLKAPGSSDDIPGNNTGIVNVFANRFVWVTEKKILGADYGIQAVVPILQKDLDFANDDNTGVGDILLSPLVLGWHGERWDAVFSAGLWLDNANAKKPADPGNGYRSLMITNGITYYLDAGKSWSFSGLTQYETHTEKSNGFKPGDQLTLEWGLGKKINNWELGLVGYNQWQTTKDSGPEAISDSFSKNAVGLEGSLFSTTLGGFLEAAYYTETSVSAASNPESKGTIFRFTIIKPF